MLDTCDYDMIKSQLNAFSLLYNVDTEKKMLIISCYLIICKVFRILISKEPTEGPNKEMFLLLSSNR